VVCDVSQMTFVHIDYECIKCGQSPIIGVRWHCYECKRGGRDFDFCEFCNSKYQHQHKLGGIKRDTEKRRGVHQVEHPIHVVDETKYDFTAAKLNNRFVKNIMKPPKERPSKIERSQYRMRAPTSQPEPNYFEDLI